LDNETIFDEKLLGRVSALLEPLSKDVKADIAAELVDGFMRDDPRWCFLDLGMIEGIDLQMGQLGGSSIVLSHLKACFIMGNSIAKEIFRKFFFEARNEMVVSFLAELEQWLLAKSYKSSVMSRIKNAVTLWDYESIIDELVEKKIDENGRGGVGLDLVVEPDKKTIRELLSLAIGGACYCSGLRYTDFQWLCRAANSIKDADLHEKVKGEAIAHFSNIRIAKFRQ